MGNGIAHVCALAGYDVLFDSDAGPHRGGPGDHQRQPGPPGQIRKITESERNEALERIRPLASLLETSATAIS